MSGVKVTAERVSYGTCGWCELCQISTGLHARRVNGALVCLRCYPLALATAEIDQTVGLPAKDPTA